MQHILRQLYFIFVIAFLSLPLCAETSSRLERQKVVKVDILMHPSEHQNEQDALFSRLKTKSGGYFSQEDFDDDLKTLAKEFDHIDPKVLKTDSGLEVTLEIWLKPKIEKIVWQGCKGISEKKLKEELGVKEGALFDRAAFTKAFNKLKNYYLKKGYFESEIDYTTTTDPTHAFVTITIHIREGRSGDIDEICFKNLSKKEEEELLELILTKEYSVFTSWLTNEGTFNPELMRHDELTILTYLQNKGYADAQITTTVRKAKKTGRIIVEIDVQKGGIYHIGDIQCEGNIVISWGQIERYLSIKKEGIYSPELVRQAVKVIQDLYGKKGYIDAQVTAEAKPVEGKELFNIFFQVQENQQFRVGLIKVFGNNRTETGVILHEVLLTPGDVFDSTKLAKSEERLRNVGYFKNVNVYPVRASQSGVMQANFRDVFVEIEENPTTAHFSTFFGFSTTESIYGGVGFNESNFRSKGFLTLFSKGFKGLRGGGEYLSMNATIGRKQLGYNASWTKPYFLDTPWAVGIDANKTRNSYAATDYTIRAYGVQLFANYPVNAFVRAGMQYRLRHSSITLKGISNKKQNQALIHESKNGGLISAFGPTLSYDSTDHPQFPKRGLRSQLLFEYAGFQGDHQFLKGAYTNSYYFTPYEYGLFRLRGNIHYIKTLGSTRPKNLPLDERLYLGGEQSMRGYVYNGVGPHFHDVDRTPRGGMSSLFFSCDYDQYLFKKIDGFVFFDAGNVFFRQFHTSGLRYSAGYGLKIKVLGNVPIIVGIGYPLNPQSKQDVKHFFFSLGASF